MRKDNKSNGNCSYFTRRLSEKRHLLNEVQEAKFQMKCYGAQLTFNNDLISFSHFANKLIYFSSQNYRKT